MNYLNQIKLWISIITKLSSYIYGYGGKKVKNRAVKFTSLYLLCLTLLLNLFTNSPKPGKLTYLPVKIKTKIY